MWLYRLTGSLAIAAATLVPPGGAGHASPAGAGHVTPAGAVPQAGPAAAAVSPPGAAVSPDGAAPDAGGVAAAAAGEFRNPLNLSADPTLVSFNGYYYLSTTLGDRLGIWKSRSLATLITAPETVVWRDTDPTRNQQVWAPALYRFAQPDGYHWYIYYTASDGTDANHRMYVVESEGDDPTGPYHFKAKLADFGVYAIDGEPFVHNGRMYFSWSSPGRNMGGPAQLYLASMSNPWTLSSGRVALPADGGCTEVREGPTTLHRNGRTFLTYSTCDTGKPDYQIWMKSVPDGADPLNPANWTQYAGAQFSRNDGAGVWGPGHHFFFRSPDGSEDWIAYHAKNTSAYNYGWRTTRAQKIGWNPDGTPNLGRPLAAGATQALPSGDAGPSPTWINDNTVSYSGTWSSGTGCGNQCFWGDDHWSGVAGNTATFSFTGTRIALFSVRDVGNGIAAMSIDGGPEQNVDYYGSPRVGEHLNYLSPPLPYGRHTLRVRVTGQKNPASSSAVISIDRAEVYGNAAPTLYGGSPTDFSGDGKDDIATFTQGSTGDVYVATSSGTGFTGTSVKWHDWFAPAGETPLTGDFNGDGKDDIVTFTHGTAADVYVALSSGSAFGGGQKWHDSFAPGAQVPAVGDFNGDGKDDIAAFSHDATADVTVALSTGSSFGTPAKWHDVFAPDGEFPAVGDVNGDGKADIVTFTQGSAGDVYVALSTGSSFGTGVKWHDFFAPGVEQPRVADVNGDRKADIVTFTNDTLGDVYVALSTGSSFGAGQKWHDWFAPAGEFPYVGDFNGDGKADIVTFTKTSDADVYVALSTGSSFGTGTKWHDYFGLPGETTL